MKTIAVIYCPSGLKEILLKGSLHRFIPARLRKLFLERMLPYWHYIIFSEMNCDVYEIQFPTVAEALSLADHDKVLKWCEQIDLLLQELKVDRVLLDDVLNESEVITGYFNSKEAFKIFNGDKLFILYIEEIFKTICKLLKVSITHLRVGLIVDGINAGIISIITRLSEGIRFLSILSLEHSNLSKMVENIYQDTGLVVRLSSTNTDLLKECNVIINFSKDSKFVNSCRIPDNSVIINYGCEVLKKNFSGIIINDLNMHNNKTSIKCHPWSKRLSFCEAILGLKGEDTDDSFDLDRLQSNYINELKGLGYRIAGFIGRNGNINMSEFDIIAKEYRRKNII